MRVTVIVPTIKGRESLLLNCLSGIFNQDYCLWDLILCTTNSDIAVTDRDDVCFINRFLKSFEQFNHTVTVLQDNYKMGPGKAIQLLMDAARTRLVFRVDDDVIITSKVLSKLVETYLEDQKNIAGVSAPVNGFGVAPVNYLEYWKCRESHLKQNGSYISMNDNCMHHAAANCSKAIAEVDFLSGYCVLLDNEKCKSVGGYISKNSPHHHKEDWFATLRLRQMGYRLLIRADAIAFHHHMEHDESDNYRTKRSNEDHKLFDQFRKNITLPVTRNLGLITYET